MITRSQFDEGELRAELENQNSIAHMLFYYDRARSFAFLTDVAAKLRSRGQEQDNQLKEYCVTLLSLYRSNPSPFSTFPIKWFDELDVGLIANCLERSYFAPSPASTEELNVLVAGLLQAQCSRSLLVLMERLDKEGRLTTLDQVFNSMAARGQLGGIVCANDEYITQVVAKLFSRLVERVTTDEFKVALSEDNLNTLAKAKRAANQIAGWSETPLAFGPLETVGDSGTILVYVGCQAPFDDVGRGIYSPEDEQFILQNCPAFDPRVARASRDFGAFAELFRSRRQVTVSANPGCRMAALGARADWLIQGHPINYGLGLGSPLEKLCQSEGKVILIGSDLDNVTLLHYAEALSPIEGKETVKLKVKMVVHGVEQIVEVEEYNSSTGIRRWPDNYFADIVQPFLATGPVVGGLLGNAATHVFRAQDLVEFAIPKMVATALELDVRASDHPDLKIAGT